MSCGVGHRLGSDLALLWLWHGLASGAPIGPLAWEILHALGVALKINQSINTQILESTPNTRNRLGAHDPPSVSAAWARQACGRAKPAPPMPTAIHFQGRGAESTQHAWGQHPGESAVGVVSLGPDAEAGGRVGARREPRQGPEAHGGMSWCLGHISQGGSGRLS